MLTPATEPELRQLALDIVEGRVFDSSQLGDDAHLMGSVFMPLAFMEPVAKEELETWGLVYEYMSAAGPRAINGYPMFMSCRVLHRDSVPRLRELVLELVDARKAFVEGREKS